MEIFLWIIILIFGYPIAVTIYSSVKASVDPQHKKKIEDAKKLYKELKDSGLNEDQIFDEISRRNQ